jgi:cell division inhibitor SepF
MAIVEPRAFSEAQSIADKFKEGTPVIMNLSSSDAELAKRLLDFASGLTYGLDGGLQKVSDKVFMLTPRNVDVSAEDRRRLKDRGLFSLDQ